MVAAVVLLVAAISRGWFSEDGQLARVGPAAGQRAVERPDRAPAERERPVPRGHVRVGGVVRPIGDVERPEREGAERAAAAPLAGIGRTPSIPLDANPHTQSVAEALQGRRDVAYRLSAMLAAPQFDRAAYQADPDGYLNEMAPGRIWQALEPGPDVPIITRDGPYYHEVLQGETVVLRAVTEPGMPVSFHSPRLGQWDNLLSSITVAADDAGVATARFTAGPGTHGEIDIQASSPVRSGFARFLVKVALPRPPVGGAAAGLPDGDGAAAGGLANSQPATSGTHPSD